MPKRSFSSVHALKPLALSIGEPAGIGTEIAAKAWMARETPGVPPFYLLADPRFVRSRLSRLGLEVPVAVVAVEDAAAAFGATLPVVALDATIDDRPGELDPATAPATIAAIETAVGHVRAGQASGLVTAPIQKSNLYAAGFKFPGHTEYLGALAELLWPGEPCRRHSHAPSARRRPRRSTHRSRRRRHRQVDRWGHGRHGRLAGADPVRAQPPR